MGAQRSSGRKRTNQQPYRCFLVRCRLEDGGPQGEPVWRFIVQQAGPDGARRSFICLHDVAAYLESELVSCGAFGDMGTRGHPIGSI
jgi:hypothetical protein